MIKISFGANTNFNPLPRKEGDFRSCRPCHPTGYFNPLPRKEGDAACPFCFMPMLAFQSTPS